MHSLSLSVQPRNLSRQPFLTVAEETAAKNQTTLDIRGGNHNMMEEEKNEELKRIVHEKCWEQ